MPNDQPIQLQQDNVQPVPGTGAGVRTLLVTVMVNNVPTQVAMQAIAVADADGHVIDFSSQPTKDLLTLLLQEQRITNQMLSALSGISYIPTISTTVDPVNTSV